MRMRAVWQLAVCVLLLGTASAVPVQSIVEKFTAVGRVAELFLGKPDLGLPSAIPQGQPQQAQLQQSGSVSTYTADSLEQAAADVQATRQNDEALKCELCKTAVESAENKLETPQVQQELISWVDGMCAATGLPQTFKEECDAFASEYLGTFVSNLVNHLNPNITCERIGACDVPDLSDEVKGAKC